MCFQGSWYARMSSVVCGRNLQIELMIVLFPVGDICYVHFEGSDGSYGTIQGIYHSLDQFRRVIKHNTKTFHGVSSLFHI